MGTGSNKYQVCDFKQHVPVNIVIIMLTQQIYVIYRSHINH